MRAVARSVQLLAGAVLLLGAAIILWYRYLPCALPVRLSPFCTEEQEPTPSEAASLRERDIDTEDPTDGISTPFEVSSIATGWRHSLMIATHKGHGHVENKLFVFGNNEEGQLGTGSTLRYSKPTELKAVGDVVDVCGGNAHSLTVDREGKVMAFGRNFRGMLGNGKSGDGAESYTPVESDFSRFSAFGKVVGVACGSEHSAAWTEKGALFAWGSNEKGQLGVGDARIRDRPTKVEGGLKNERVVGVSAGRYHTLAVCASGRVYAWGAGGKGQTGLGMGGNFDPHQYVNEPMEVRLPDGVMATGVAAGEEHSLVVSASQQVFAFGDGYFGQLGTGKLPPHPLQSNMNSLKPIEVAALSGLGVESVTAADDASFATTSEGALYAWGYAYHGQLGLPVEAQRESRIGIPTEVLSRGVKSVAKVSTSWHSLVLMQNGSVLASGLNDSGQCGLGESAPEKLEEWRAVEPLEQEEEEEGTSEVASEGRGTQKGEEGEKEKEKEKVGEKEEENAGFQVVQFS